VTYFLTLVHSFGAASFDTYSHKFSRMQSF